MPGALCLDLTGFHEYFTRFIWFRSENRKQNSASVSQLNSLTRVLVVRCVSDAAGSGCRSAQVTTCREMLERSERLHIKMEDVPRSGRRRDGERRTRKVRHHTSFCCLVLENQIHCFICQSKTKQKLHISSLKVEQEAAMMEETVMRKLSDVQEITQRSRFLTQQGQSQAQGCK